MRAILRRLAIGTAMAGTALLGALVVYQLTLSTTLEWKIYDLLFQKLGDRPARASPDIVMIKIDDLTLERMAENGLGRFPWPRDTYAVVLDYLRRGSPKVVAFDLTFPEEDKSTVGGKAGSEGDREFALATERIGVVIHGIDVNDTVVSKPQIKSKPELDLGLGIEEHASVKLPFEVLAQSSRMLGHTFMVFDSDGPVRRSVPFIRQGNVSYPSISLATAMLAMGVQPSDISLSDAGLRFGPREIPLLDVEQEYINKVQARHILTPYKASAYTNDQRDTTTYPSYRFWDVLLSELQLREGKKPELEPSIFRDKVVFIGVTAGGLHDIFPTPYGDTGKMPGMQVHASLVDGILNDSFIRPAGWAPTILMAGMTALAVSFIGISSGFWWSILAGGGVALANAGFIAWSFQQGTWVRSVLIAYTLLLAQFMAVAYKYFVEDRAKREAHALFSRYVPPAVVRELLKDPSKARLGGARREMTVLFSDIRGFTTLSEAGRPEDIIEQLNEYFSHMVEILFQHQGTLDKFVGDMIMALFNAPLDDPDHADHAVQMGLAMLEGLEKLNVKWEAEGKPRFDIGIGINSGDMIAGNVGSDKTLSYTVIGDNVNLGSRLESLNKDYGTHIIISESTRRLLKGTYNLKPLGSAKVKGKTHEIAIYEVLGRTNEG